MTSLVEKIFNFWTLLALNIVIILAAEFTGGGTFFYDTGLVHAIAVFFIILSESRVFVHYHTHDQYLEKLVHTSLIAMAVLAVSHFVEFISYMVLKFHEDAVFANVANFYIISLLLITLGAQMFIDKHDQNRRIFSKIIIALILFQAFVICLFLARDELITLETRSPGVLIYIAGILIAAALTIYKLARIKRLVSISRPFINYLIAAVALIAVSAIQNILYEFFEETLGMPQYQIIYLAHFEFYIALSFFFLSFVRISKLGGLYQALEEKTQ